MASIVASIRRPTATVALRFQDLAIPFLSARVSSRGSQRATFQ